MNTKEMARREYEKLAARLERLKEETADVKREMKYLSKYLGEYGSKETLLEILREMSGEERVAIAKEFLRRIPWVRENTAYVYLGRLEREGVIRIEDGRIYLERNER